MILCFFSNSLWASHLIGAEINVVHDSAFNYNVSLKLYRDSSGISLPPSAAIYIFSRSLLSNFTPISLPFESSNTLTVNSPTCQNVPVILEENLYRASIYFDPSIYNDPAGYYLTFLGCCGSAATTPSNIYTSPAPLSTITLIPPVVDSLGQPFVNSNPILNSPIEQFACNQNVYSENFGGNDPDGDSIVYKLFTPLSTSVTNPSVTATSFPYVDPTTQWQGVNWAPGYDVNNQINGSPGPAPSPNRLKIDSISGEMTLIANESPGYYMYGIWTQEFRNGILIGSIFRQLPLLVLDCGPYQNAKPQILANPHQICGIWNGDTLVFNSRLACIDIQITDPDSNSFLELDIIHASALIDSFYFSVDILTINPNDIFNSSVHLIQDSFDSQIRELKIKVNNPHCSGLQTDTLIIPYQFVNFSNAGAGGIFDCSIDQSQTPIELFSLLSGDPNPNGTWIDLDTSTMLNSNNEFIAQNVFTPSTYRFLYIDHQPHYPPDTASLTLNFVYPNSIEDHYNNRIEVYPNPANRVLTITGISKTSNFEIVDIQGKKIRSVLLSREQNTVNTAGLKEGLYFFQCQNQRGKFLIQR